MPWYQGCTLHAAGNLGIKLLDRNLARFGDHVVDRQFEQPQVFWRKIIPIASASKNLNGFFAVRHSEFSFQNDAFGAPKGLLCTCRLPASATVLTPTHPSRALVHLRDAASDFRYVSSLPHRSPSTRRQKSAL